MLFVSVVSVFAFVPVVSVGGPSTPVSFAGGGGAAVVPVSVGGACGCGCVLRGRRARGAGTATVVVGAATGGAAGAVIVCAGGCTGRGGVCGTVGIATLPDVAVIVEARFPFVVDAVVPLGRVNAVVVSTLVFVMAVAEAGGVVSPGALIVDDAPD